MGSQIGIAIRPIAGIRPVRQTDDDEASAKARGNGYGEAYVRCVGDAYDALLDEGTLYLANGYAGDILPGTGVPLGPNASTTFVETAAAMAFLNTSRASQAAAPVILDYLRLLCTVAPTGASNLSLVLTLDEISPRVPAATDASGNRRRVDPLSNVGGNMQPALEVLAGNLTLNAATASRKFLGRIPLKTVAPVVNDEFVLKFNNFATPPAISNLASATAQHIVRSMPKVRIEPGWALFVHLYATGQTAAGSFEFDSVHYEH